MYYIAVLAHSKRTKEFYSPDRKRSGLFCMQKKSRGEGNTSAFFIPVKLDLKERIYD